MSINIVLFQPEIPQNTGNIIRTCANIGATLHLIKPLGFSLQDKYLKRSGLDYWDIANIQYYDSFQELRDKFPNEDFFFSTTKGHKSHSDVNYSDGCFIVFGRETKGLPDYVVEGQDEYCVRIPMRDIEGARCLNLSNAVAIVAYEAMRQLDYADLK